MKTTRLARFGVIGDVHAEDERLGRALGHMRQQDLDAILCVGDLVDGPGSANACLEMLQAEGVITVAGNHDRWFLANEVRDLPYVTAPESVSDEGWEYLRALPKTRSLDSLAGPVLLCHGLGDDDMAGVRPRDSRDTLADLAPWHALLTTTHRWVVNGHTHEPMVRVFRRTPRADGSVDEPLTIINGGTLLRDNGAGFAVVDLPRAVAVFYSFDDAGIVDGWYSQRLL